LIYSTVRIFSTFQWLFHLNASPVIYNSLRFNVQENTVTFHLLNKDWKEIKAKKPWLFLVEIQKLPAFQCNPVDLRAVSSERFVDPVEAFGLFAVQTFDVSDMKDSNSSSQLLEVR